MTVSDYFAELYVAGKFADAGWNVYFPHRDKGFDFIASKPISNGEQVIRPVQVKGKYPTEGKTDKRVYGYVGRLSQLNKQMVLAIPFFAVGSPAMPACVAYLPRSLIKLHARGFRCQPAAYRQGVPAPRKEYARFFDQQGIDMLARSDWSELQI